MLPEPSERPLEAIVGAGNGGLALAGDLALRGWPVGLLEHPHYAEGFRAVETASAVGVRDGGSKAPRQEAKLLAASLDPSRIVPGADLVHLVLPVSAQAAWLPDLLSMISDDQCLVLWAGRFGGMHLRERLNATGRPGPAVIEVNTLPYGCRRTAPAEVTIVFRALRLYAGGTGDAAVLDSAFARLEQMFPVLQRVPHMLEAALRNSALPVLSVGTLLNVGAVERLGGRFALFRDGLSPSVRRSIRQVYEEMQAVASAAGVSIADYDDATFDAPATIEGANFADAQGGSDGFLSLTGPDRVCHRYTLENVEFGLKVIRALGARLGARTPAIDALCDLYDMLCAGHFHERGWQLEDLGLTRDEN